MTNLEDLSDDTKFHLKIATEDLLVRLTGILDHWLAIKAEPLNPYSSNEIDRYVEDATANLDAARTAFAGLPDSIRPANFL